MSEKEVKKITLGYILSWIFGILFLLFGMGTIPDHPFIGVLIILLSALVIPYTNGLLREKYNIEISGGVVFVIVIIILILSGFAMPSNQSYAQNQQENNVPVYKGEDSTVKEENLTPVVADKRINPKTEYIQKYLKLEDVEVGEGYGALDIPGYDKKKPTVTGIVRNTGNRTIESLELTVYFLDKNGNRIWEEQYHPIGPNILFGDATPLKPNYVREWGYVINDPPKGWDKRVEVVISDITFEEE